MQPYPCRTSASQRSGTSGIDRMQLDGRSGLTCLLLGSS